MTIPTHVRAAMTVLRKWTERPPPPNQEPPMPDPTATRLPEPILTLVAAIEKAWQETPEDERIVIGRHVIGLHPNGVVNVVEPPKPSPSMFRVRVG